MIRLTGTPQVFDTLLRPVVRAVQVVLGVAGAALLVSLGDPLWAPVPLLASLAIYEAFFWWRGDRPVTLSLGDALVFEDPIRGQRLALRPEEVHVATLYFRNMQGDRRRLHLVLGDRTGPRFAVELAVDATVAVEARDVDLDALDVILGGFGDPLETLASPTVTCRQIIDDPAGQVLAWARRRIPPTAWDRIGVRVWRGLTPRLDERARHLGHPDGWLLVGGDQYALTFAGQTRTGLVGPVRASRAMRAVPRVSADDEGRTVPLLLLHLDADLTLTFPAPIAGSVGPAAPLDDDLLHTHVIEAGAVVWALLTRWPRSAWPAALRQSIEVAAATTTQVSRFLATPR